MPATTSLPPDRVTLAIEFGGRMLFAVLAATYFLAVPAARMPVDTMLLVASLALYLVVQTLLFVTARPPRARRWPTATALLVDFIAATGALASDPAAVPPTSLMLFAVALNAGLRTGWQAPLAAVASTGLAVTVALSLRHDLYAQMPVPAFLFLLAFLAVALAGLTMQSFRRGQLQEQARRQAGLDPETQLLDRRGFDDAARYLVPLHQRTQLPLVILLAALDARGGPLDARTLAACVRQVGHIVRQRARRSDVVARLGDTEIVFLLFDTPLAGGESLARAMLERFDAWTRQQEIDARLTFGMAITPEEPMAIDQIIARARGAIQRAQKHPSAPAVVTAPSF